MYTFIITKCDETHRHLDVITLNQRTKVIKRGKEIKISGKLNHRILSTYANLKGHLQYVDMIVYFFKYFCLMVSNLSNEIGFVKTSFTPISQNSLICSDLKTDAVNIIIFKFSICFLFSS